MATFVLVHGGWHGGWCWSQTEEALRRLGHRTHAPTLTGLGERSHLLRADIDPDLHVQDIVNYIIWRELSGVILVGHSYGGMIISGVAGQIPERLRALVYLDAFVVEESGVPLLERTPPDRAARFMEQIEAGAPGVEPDLFDAWTDDPGIRAWLESQCTPQPAGTFTRGVTLTGREVEVSPRYFILAERNSPSAFWAEYERVKDRPDWQTGRIDARHDAMVEAPETLAGMLDAFVDGID